MRITSLQIENFRGLRDVRIPELPARVFWTGLTGAGKTTLQQAVRAVLWGRVYDHRGKALKVGEFVGPWGKQASVNLGLEVHDQPMVAKWSASARESGLTVQRQHQPALAGSPREVRADLWDFIGMPAEPAECAGNPRAYLTCRDVGDLLAGLGGAEINQDKLTLELGPHADWFRSYCRAGGLAYDTHEGLSAIGKSVLQSRRDLKHDIQKLEQEIANLQDATLPADSEGRPISTDSLAEVNIHLDVLTDTRDKLQRELGASEGKRSAASIANDLKQVQEKADQARQRLREATKNERKAREQQARYTKVVSEARNRESDLRGQLALAEGSLKKAQRALDELGDQERCPYCKRKLTDAAKAKLVAPLEQDQQEAGAECKDLGIRLATWQRQMKGIQKDLEAAQDKLDTARGALGEAQSALAEAEGRVAVLKAERPASDRTADEVQAEIATMDERIAAGRLILQSLHRVDQRRTLQAELGERQTELEHLEWAVTAFEKGAIQKPLGADGQRMFVDQCNQQLEAFGYQLALEVVGKDVTVLMGRTGGQMIPVSQASEGEFVLAQLSLAMGFAGDGGLVMVDGLDKLDARHKGRVFETLAQCNAGTIWLAGAYGLPGDPDLAMMSEALAPVGVIWVQGGGVT